MDHNTTSYRQLLAQRNALDEQIAQARNVERMHAIDEIRARMDEFEITVQELGRALGKRMSKGGPKGGPIAPKYRNPESGATWSGRGKPPAWIAGKDRGSFLIES
jgi:DNA-binding protein H-NS